MKAEQTISTTGAAALEKLNEVIQRIEAKRAELARELAKTEAELEARKTGATKAGSFDLADILENDNNEVTEKLKAKILKIKAALALPNYADADFRKYSIIYLEEVVEEHIAERKAHKEEIERLEKELYNLPHTISEKRNELGGILDRFCEKAANIGLTSEFSGIWTNGATNLFAEYKKVCATYDD